MMQLSCPVWDSSSDPQTVQQGLVSDYSDAVIENPDNLSSSALEATMSDFHPAQRPEQKRKRLHHSEVPGFMI